MLLLFRSGCEKKPCLSSIEVVGFVSRLAFSKRPAFSSPHSALSYRMHASPSVRIGKVESSRDFASSEMI
jgi:hypothetical protein